MGSWLDDSLGCLLFWVSQREERLGAIPLPLALELEMRQRQRAISGTPVRYHMKVKKCWLQCLLCDSISKRYCTTWGGGWHPELELGRQALLGFEFNRCDCNFPMWASKGNAKQRALACTKLM